MSSKVWLETKKRKQEVPHALCHMGQLPFGEVSTSGRPRAAGDKTLSSF